MPTEGHPGHKIKVYVTVKSLWQTQIEQNRLCQRHFSKNNHVKSVFPIPYMSNTHKGDLPPVRNLLGRSHESDVRLAEIICQISFLVKTELSDAYFLPI